MYIKKHAKEKMHNAQCRTRLAGARRQGCRHSVAVARPTTLSHQANRIYAI